VRALTTRRIERCFAAGLLAIAAWLRYRFIFELNPPSQHLYSDMLAFVRRAQNVLDGRFVPYDTLFPPGQHLLIALSGALFDGYDTLVVWAHLGAGVLTCYWVWRAAERLLGRSAALAVLVMVTFHLPFIGLAGFYLAETMFTAFLSLLFLLLARSTFPPGPLWASGVALVATAATFWKGTNALFLPIVGIWSLGWAWGRPPDAWRRLAVSGVAMVVMAAALLGGQMVYFWRFYGRWVPVPAEGATVFALGKCPGARIVARGGALYESPRTLYTGEGGTQRWDAEFPEQGFFWKAGIDCIRRRPAVLLESVISVAYLFGGNELWPLNTTRFEAFSAWYGRMFGLAIIPGVVLGVLALGRRPFAVRVVPFLLLASVLSVAWLFLAELRFRVPFDVAIIPLGVLGWMRALTRCWPALPRRVIAQALALLWLALAGVPVLLRLGLWG
jgi:hypothetical protein